MSDNSKLVIAALKATDLDLYTAVDAEGSFKNLLTIKGARVDKYRQYERGDHDANLTDQMRAVLRLKAGADQLDELTDNYVKIVVDKMAGRLAVEDLKTDNDAADVWLEDLKKRNRFERLAGTVHRSAVREGDSYILISGDKENKTVKWTSEPAYDGFSGMVVIFGEDEQPAWACKLWSEASENAVGDRGENRSSTVIKIIVYQPYKISYFNGDVNGGEVTKWKDEKVGLLASCLSFTLQTQGTITLLTGRPRYGRFTPCRTSSTGLFIPCSRQPSSVASRQGSQSAWCWTKKALSPERC